MALWFSASAVVPSLVAEYALSPTMQAALTSAVQAGFVVGCLVSAFFSLADRLDPRRFIAAAALLGAGGQCTAAGDRPDHSGCAAAALRHWSRDGRRLSGRHEARLDLGPGRHGTDGGHPRGRPHPRIGRAASAQSAGRRRRLAHSGCADIGERRRRCAADRVRRNRSRKSAGPALRSARRAGGVARRAVAAGQPRLPRPYVGTLCNVGVDRRVPARELRTDVAAGRRFGAREARRVRHRRGRRDRLRRRRLSRRSRWAHCDHDRVNECVRDLRRRRRSALRRAANAGDCRLHYLGHLDRRRFGAIFGLDRRAGGPDPRRHDADRADRDGIHADSADDPLDAGLD